MEKKSATAATIFDNNYQLHLKHLKLKGLQPKTIEAYSRAIRRVGNYFDHQIEHLTETDLMDYFTDLRETHSWSSVKLDLYGLKLYHEHVLKKPWAAPGLIKPPRSQRIPDIITIEETERIFMATRVLSYRVFFFTLYSLGLRLGEGLRLTVADIDGPRARAYPRYQRQQGSSGATTDGDVPPSASFLAASPESRFVVSESSRWLGWRAYGEDTA